MDCCLFPAPWLWGDEDAVQKGTGWKVGWILKVVAVSYTKELELLKWLLSPLAAIGPVWSFYPL